MIGFIMLQKSKFSSMQDFIGTPFKKDWVLYIYKTWTQE